jgi:hypothetical protein
MTGNFSNGKSLKPGDTAFNSRKVTGGDQFSGNRVMNTNSNFNLRNTGNNLDMNMGANKYKFNENDMNEAKDALKLLKMKMGGGGSMPSIAQNKNTTTNNYNQNFQGMNPGQGLGGNNNYRKPFKPTFDNEDSNTIQIDTKKNIMGGRTLGATPSNQTNQNYNNKINSNVGSRMNQNSNNQKIKPQPMQQVNELVDDRPAFATGATTGVDVNEEPEDYDDGEVRVQCSVCDRKFREDVIYKHEKVCKKVFVDKRKTFNTQKQRIIDSEHATMLKYKEKEEKKNEKALKNGVQKPISKKAKWKKQSEEFRAILRNNNTVTTGFGPNNSNTKGGRNINNGPKPGTSGFVPTPSVFTEDYISCNMCNRRYNENAYSKHLPTCERRTKEAAMKNKNKPQIGGNMMNNTGTAYGNKPNLNVKFGKK